MGKEWGVEEWEGRLFNSYFHYKTLVSSNSRKLIGQHISRTPFDSQPNINNAYIACRRIFCTLLLLTEADTLKLRYESGGERGC